MNFLTKRVHKIVEKQSKYKFDFTKRMENKK